MKAHFKKKKIMITGGAGFIGSQLGFILSEKGYQVLLLDNMSYGLLDNLIIEGKTFGQFICRDVRDGNLQTYFDDIDCVVHLAGIAPLSLCQVAPAQAFDVNLTGTANVLEMARVAGVRRFILSSTSAVYECSDHDPHTETEIVKPNLIYAITKHAAESLCSAFAQNYNMDIVICRFFNVYGPHQDMMRASPSFTSYVARELAADRQPTLFNRSNAKRDYIHSADLVALLEKIIVAPKRYEGEIFNVGSGTGYSVPELYKVFLDVSEKSIEPNFVDPAGYWNAYERLFTGEFPLSKSRIIDEVHKNSVADIAKVSREFDWNPLLNIQQGIQSVYEYAIRSISP